LIALENSALAKGVTSNLSWLMRALLESRREEASARAITTFVHRWLAMYSPAPERMMAASHSTSSADRLKEWNKLKDIIDANIAAFGTTEKALLNSLIMEERGDYSGLSEIAFKFLAGASLKKFGQSFRSWCFAASFNGGLSDVRRDFDNLIQLNLVDWLETRADILKASELLKGPDISETWKWALVRLNATGDSADAKQAEEVYEELTKDRRSVRAGA
jgi:hypothetical protein